MQKIGKWYPWTGQVSQELGLRPIGYSHRRSWKTGRRLAYNFPVLCTDLNLFCIIHFPMLNSSVGWVRNFAFQHDRCRTAVKPELETLPREVKHENDEIWRWNIDLSIYCINCCVYCDLFNWEQGFLHCPDCSNLNLNITKYFRMTCKTRSSFGSSGLCWFIHIHCWQIVPWRNLNK